MIKVSAGSGPHFRLRAPLGTAPPTRRLSSCASDPFAKRLAALVFAQLATFATVYHGRVLTCCVWWKGSFMKGQRRRPGRGMPFRNPSLQKGWRVRRRLSARSWCDCRRLVIGGGSPIPSSRGLSAHEQPSRVEALLARTMRRLATPEAVRTRRNPVQLTETVVERALAHYAEHCTACHANDGSGDTEIGRGLYPRVPDMRSAETQSRLTASCSPSSSTGSV